MFREKDYLRDLKTKWSASSGNHTPPFEAPFLESFMVNNDILALIEEEKMAKGGIKGGLQDTSDWNEEISLSVDKEGKQKRYTCKYNNKQKAKK